METEMELEVTLPAEYDMQVLLAYQSKLEEKIKDLTRKGSADPLGNKLELPDVPLMKSVEDFNQLRGFLEDMNKKIAKSSLVLRIMEGQRYILELKTKRARSIMEQAITKHQPTT